MLFDWTEGPASQKRLGGEREEEVENRPIPLEI